MRNGRRIIAVVAASAGISWMSGCNATKHADARLQADDRWTAVRADLKMQLAEQSLIGHRFEEAADAAAEAALLDPSRPKAYAIMAEARLELGDEAGASRAVEAATSAGVRSPDILYMQGVLEEHRGRPEAAVGYYSQARAEKPGEIDYLIAHAESLTALGRAGTALQEVNAASTMFEGNAQFAALAGTVAEAAGERAEALRWYRRARSLGTEDRLLPMRLGCLLVEDGRYDEAVLVLEGVLSAEPGEAVVEPLVIRSLARALLECDRARDALSLCRKHEQELKDDFVGQLLLARSAMRAGESGTAARAIRRARVLRRDDPRVALLQAGFSVTLGDREGAIETLEELVRRNPDEQDGLCMLAELYSDAGRREDARARFQQALALDGQCRWASAGLKRLP